jgi:hypothetical protein
MVNKERKRIKKEIVMQFDKSGDHLIFDDLRTLCMAMGTKSLSGNYHFYGIEKKDNEWWVKIETIKARLQKKKAEIRKTQEYIDVMEKIIEAAEGER